MLYIYMYVTVVILQGINLADVNIFSIARPAKVMIIVNLSWQQTAAAIAGESAFVNA